MPSAITCPKLTKSRNCFYEPHQLKAARCHVRELRRLPVTSETSNHEKSALFRPWLASAFSVSLVLFVTFVLLILVAWGEANRNYPVMRKAEPPHPG